MKIVGNKAVTDLTAATVRKGREPHSVMITGEAGLGKRTMARYYAAQLMCEQHDGTPCGRCRACSLLERNVHPDFITIRPNDKGNYAVEDIRDQVVSDSVVMPNEGDIKVYLIADMDKSRMTSAQVQNILLKLIEEPPDHVAVIMTAAGKESFLPTVISRTLCLNMVHVTDRESAQYLQETCQDKSPGEIAEAVRAGRGNIGRCLSYLEKGPFYEAVAHARNTGAALAAGDEYGVLRALYPVEGKRALLKETLILLSETVRDAGVIACGGGSALTGCDEQTARALAGKLLPSGLRELYEFLTEQSRRIDSNCTAGMITAEIAFRSKR